MRGNCYVTSEALFHLLGSGWKPMYVKHEGDTHWFLKNADGTILDATKKQFKTTPNYSKGRGCGFLTTHPSKRAKELMEKMLWQNI